MRSRTRTSTSALFLPVLSMLSLFIICLVPGTQAHGQPCPDRLRREAKQLLGKGRHAEGIEKLLSMGERCLKEDDLWEIGWAYERLGHRRRALAYYARMAEKYPPEKRALFLKGKEQRLRWDPVSTVSIKTTPESANLLIDGQKRGTMPKGNPLKLQLGSGEHRVVALLEGHGRREQTFTVEFGEPLELILLLERENDSTDSTSPKEQGAQVARADSQKAAPPPAPEPRTEAADDAELEKDTDLEAGPPDNRVFLGILVGPSWADYGDPTLSAGVALELGADAGYLWRRLWGTRWLGLHLHGTVLYTPVLDPEIEDQSGFVSLLAGGGARAELWRLWIDLRLSLGASLLLGASEKSFFFDGATRVSGVFAHVGLRAALGLGWTLWRGLSLSVYPLALDYMPRIAEFNEGITQVLRYHLTMAAGWSL